MDYSDLGSCGSEIPTPDLDGLAKGGWKFTQFYNVGRWCPTRASLLTGLNPHQAGDHLNEYHEKGYVPVDARKDTATSCTLECAYGDFCVSRLAKAAGHDDDFKLLMRRA